MNIGNIIGYIGVGIAIILAVRGEWWWAIGVAVAGAALGGLVNMMVVKGMRRSLPDSDDDRQ